MMNSLKLVKILLFIACFLLSWTTLGIYGQFIALLILFIYYLLIGAPFKRFTFVETGILLLLLIISILRFQTQIIFEVPTAFNNAFIGNLVKYIILILTWFLLRNIFYRNEIKEQVLKFIPYLLILNVVVFIVQFLTFLITRYYIDIAVMFTGEPSRYLSFDSSLAGIGSFRPTGIYSEPSNYFYVVLTLVIMMFLNNRKSMNKTLIISTIITMYLSFSTTAVIVASLLALFLLIVNGAKFKTYFLTIIILIPLIINFSPKLKTLQDSQINKYDRSSESRMAILDYLLNEQDEHEVLSYGAFAVPSTVYYSSTTEVGDKSMASTNDSGLLVYLWLRFGFLGIFSFIGLIYLFYKKEGKNGVILFLLLSLTKISPFTSLFIFLLALCFSKPNFKNKKQLII